VNLCCCQRWRQCWKILQTCRTKFTKWPLQELLHVSESPTSKPFDSLTGLFFRCVTHVDCSRFCGLRWQLFVTWFLTTVHFAHKYAQYYIVLFERVFLHPCWHDHHKMILFTAVCNFLCICRLGFLILPLLFLHRASWGAVYCNRSCLRVCVGGSSITTITRNCVHRSSPNWVGR